ncbi:MAG: VOC family protein [Bacteroidia bacterium]|nr:VOC family protein [Bacteroidia bacterium]NND09865.1 VOC family protein [Flavobacteriaceae bacterium]MBT8310463.1 VOC family protein [Bacteroidia bacterium]NNK27910.1 VOC family protein [Flavobacteriaceae bacterium]NNL60556.1 VOC family protein [Flavobacteriaceae bacterium]
MKNNIIPWVEIPVTDMDRAKAFYDNVFGIDIQVQDFQGTLMGWFPYDEKKTGISGSLVKNEAYNPSESHGAVVYFDSEDIDATLAKVEANGGRIKKSKTQIAPNIGYMGLFIDSEGNRIALYTTA